MPNLTAKLARHIVGYRSAELDRAALTVAKQCVLDWYGVTLAGSNEPVARILREEMATSEQGPASIVASISAARRSMLH
jgi:2-methylcitrate dehydratase PrpD